MKGVISSAILLVPTKRSRTMTLRHSTPTSSALNTLLPSSKIRNRARDTGTMQRMRKIDIVAFVWTLVLGFGDGSARTIAGLRRNFERSTGVHVVPSAFYDRFNRHLVNLLKSLVHDVIDQLIPPAHGIGGAMAMFR